MQEITTNQNFKNLIPPLDSDEFKRLEQSIIDEGCRDPIMISDNEIIDGHNRYNICTKHNISFKTQDKSFNSDDEKIVWIINNQLARRNISKYDRTRLALKQEELYAKQAKEQQKRKPSSVYPMLGKQKVAKKPLNTDKKVANKAKVAHGTVAKVKVIEKNADDETKKKLSEQKITINKVYKDIVKAKKREAIGKNNVTVPLPNKKYDIIYSDPPWNFKLYSDKGRDRSPANYYRLQDIDDLKKMPIQDLASDDCILFMWVTYPFLEKAMDVIKEWGFKYKTCAFVWVKKNKNIDSWFWGLGYWTRSNSELCLLATKGSPKRKSSSVHEVICTKIEEHSKKPNIVKDKIVELMGDIPRIELFARQKTKGWDVWGDEI